MEKNQIILIYPDNLSLEANTSPYVQLASFPQLGLLYLASQLRRQGFEPIYVDPVVRPLNIEEISLLVQSGQVLFVGIYSNFGLRQDVCGFITAIKKKFDLPVIIGGPGFYEARHYFKAGADAVVCGEADEIIVLIADAIKKGKSIHDIQGVILADNNQQPVFPLTPPIKDLDRLPYPAWDLAPPTCFKNYLGFYTRHPYYVVTASRGCPMKCAFCATNIYKKGAYQYRLRSVDSVIEEIETLHRFYQIKHIKFQDDNFGADHDWMRLFCERMIALKLPVKWNCSMHPLFFKKNPEKILRIMKNAGCLSVHFGLQSADPTILNRIHRSSKEPRIILELTPLMKRLGFYTIIDFIYGLPGETRETMRGNLHFALSSKVHMIQVTPLTVIPGSELYEQYGDQPVTRLTPEEIYSAIKKTNKTFFSRPRLYMENLAFGLKNNPFFFINLINISPFLLKLIFGRFPMIHWTESKGIGYYNQNE